MSVPRTARSVRSTVSSDREGKRLHDGSRTRRMDDVNADRLMIAAGVVISLIAAYGCYPSWKNALDDRE